MGFFFCTAIRCNSLPTSFKDGSFFFKQYKFGGGFNNALLIRRGLVFISFILEFSS